MTACLVATTAHAQDASVSHAITGAAITLPPGAYLRYDLTAPLGESGLRAGPYASYLVYSAEVGGSLGWATDPAWLEAHVDLGFEPGFFLEVGDESRELRWRAVVRGQVNLNLQLRDVWIYARSTALYRFRNFEEDDVFQKLRLRHELSFEQAVAPIFRLAGLAPGPALWVYPEYTIGVIEGELQPHRASVGAILERWPSEAVMLNLDLFWSFVPGLDGPGAILAWWIRW